MFNDMQLLQINRIQLTYVYKHKKTLSTSQTNCTQKLQASCECRTNCADSSTYEVTEPEP